MRRCEAVQVERAGPTRIVEELPRRSITQSIQPLLPQLQEEKINARARLARRLRVPGLQSAVFGPGWRLPKFLCQKFVWRAVGRLSIKIDRIRRQSQHFQRDTRKSPGKVAAHRQLQPPGHSDIHKQLAREDGRRQRGRLVQSAADAAMLFAAVEASKEIAICEEIT